MAIRYAFPNFTAIRAIRPATTYRVTDEVEHISFLHQFAAIKNYAEFNLDPFGISCRLLVRT